MLSDFEIQVTILRHLGGPGAPEPNAWLLCKQACVMTSHVVPFETSVQNIVLSRCHAPRIAVDVGATHIFDNLQVTLAMFSTS